MRRLLDQFMKQQLQQKRKIRKIRKRKKRLSLPSKSVPVCIQQAPRSASDICKGSLTVEAALVSPLVLFVFLFFLSFFRMLQVEQMTQEALALAGAKVSVEAGRSEGDMAEAVLYASALTHFQRELSHQAAPVKYVVGGNGGFSFAGTDVRGELLDLRLSYQLSLPLNLFNKKLSVKQRISLKKWDGFHRRAQEEDGDAWVYITETGTVYHLNRDCSYLKLSIQTVPCNQAISSGYSACHLCGGKETSYGYYYITNEGSRYHTSLTCSGLKRTVYMIKLSQTGGRGRCTRCGGG